MAWGYSPRPVVKVRKATLDRSKSKSLGILLLFVGASAGLLAFGIMSQVLDRSDVPEQDSLMLKVDGEESENPELLIAPKEGVEGENAVKRKYRVYWKKPSGPAAEWQKSTWEQDQEKQKRERTPDKMGDWDQAPR